MIVICKKCGKSFNSGKDKNKKFCSRACANSHVQTKEQNEARSKKLKRIPILKTCRNCENTISKNNKSGLCKDCLHKSEEYRNAVSEGTKGKCGGFRKGSGIGRSGWYKEYWCDSSWELAYVIYCLDHGIKIIRNTSGFEYTYNGEIHKYYPDFILDDGSYVEIKGYLDEKNLAKISQFSGKLKVISGEDIDLYLQYAKETYGTDYVNLIDDNRPKYKHICIVCNKEFETNRKTGVCCSRSCTGKHLVELKKIKL